MVYDQAVRKRRETVERGTPTFTEPTEGEGIGAAYLYQPGKTDPIKVISGHRTCQDFEDALHQDYKKHIERFNKISKGTRPFRRRSLGNNDDGA